MDTLGNFPRDDFYAWEQVALKASRPVIFTADLGGSREVFHGHARYNHICFVEHVMGISHEQQWAEHINFLAWLCADCFETWAEFEAQKDDR